MAEKVTIGNCELWHGDCREVLPLLPPVDLVLTDPPYGIGAASRSFQNGTSRNAAIYGDEWDAAPPKRWLIDMVVDHGKHAILWGGNYFGLDAARCWLVWDKCTGDNSYADAELAWTNIDAVVRVLRHPWVGANAKEKGEDRLHPTQKPVRVMEWSIERAPASDTVCDPFLGSGTSGVAAVKMGRTFVGIEREPKYFEIACRRIEQAYAQPRLFEDAKVGAGDTAAQGDMLLPANVQVQRQGKAQL